MTREHKLALIIGFSVFMVVGVLVGDYFSKARLARVDPGLAMSGEVAVHPPMQADPIVPSPVEEIAPRVERTVFQPIELDMTGNPALTKADVLPAGDEGVSALVNGWARPVPTAVPPVDAAKSYQVRPKDTLIKLARDYYQDESLWQKLLEYNKSVLKGKDTLTVGMTLKLPSKDVLLGRTPGSSKAGAPDVKLTPKQAAVAKKDIAKGTTTRTYQVKRGDTLGDIAIATLGTSKRWREIEKLNPRVDAESLREGMVLKLPTE